MAPASRTDVFGAVAGAYRREILDALLEGEKSVGTIVDQLEIPQPAVSKHLRALGAAGLVTCRAAGRRRLYRLEPSHLRPLTEWVAKYEQVLEGRLDRMGGYLKAVQQQGGQP